MTCNQDSLASVATQNKTAPQGRLYYISISLRRAIGSRGRLYEATRKTEEARVKQEEAVRQEQRRKAYTEAQRREADRVGSILGKQQAKDKALAELGKKRDHEADLKSLKHQLDLENKRDKVDLPCNSTCN